MLRCRFTVFFVLFSCVVTLMLILCLVLLSDGAKSRIKARRHVSDSKTEKFTIIIRTSKAGYLSDVFKQFMRLPVLDRIIVLWNGVDPVPDIGSRNIDVVFVPKAVDRVRNRLRRFTEIRTEGMIIIVLLQILEVNNITADVLW